MNLKSRYTYLYQSDNQKYKRLMFFPVELSYFFISFFSLVDNYENDLYLFKRKGNLINKDLNSTDVYFLATTLFALLSFMHNFSKFPYIFSQ